MPNTDNKVWRLLHANGVDPYCGEIESISLDHRSIARSQIDNCLRVGPES
jgi:hypothetical protein